MALYKRIAAAPTRRRSRARRAAAEDRYGAAPPAFRALLELARLRLLARSLGVKALQRRGDELAATLEKDHALDPAKVLDLLRKPGRSSRPGPTRSASRRRSPAADAPAPRPRARVRPTAGDVARLPLARGGRVRRAAAPARCSSASHRGGLREERPVRRRGPSVVATVGDRRVTLEEFFASARNAAARTRRTSRRASSRACSTSTSRRSSSSAPSPPRGRRRRARLPPSAAGRTSRVAPASRRSRTRTSGRSTTPTRTATGAPPS